MAVRVQEQDFDVGREIAALTAGRTDVGAVVAFVGLVRDVAGSDAVKGLTLEHYPGMTEKALETIEAKAIARWPLTGTTIIHRVGSLKPGDQIVLTLASSAHRAAAFEACAFLMDYLKTKAPFWKREETPEGPRWVDARATDDEAAARWRD